GDKRALVARRPRRLVDLAPIRAVAEKPVAAHGHPLPGVFRAMLLDPAQLAGKVNGAVAWLDFGLLFAVERLAQSPLLIRRESPRFFNDSVHVCRCHSLLSSLRMALPTEIELYHTSSECLQK